MPSNVALYGRIPNRMVPVVQGTRRADGLTIGHDLQMAATNNPVTGAKDPLPGTLRATGVDDTVLGRQFLPAIETSHRQ